MNKGLAIGLVIAGALLLIWGIQEANSFSSDVSRFFTDSPTDRSIWLIVLGVVAMAAGLFGLGRRQAP